MKPNGLSMGVLDSGNPSKVEDAIREAVKMAIEDGWSPARFKYEIADAWREKLTDQAKVASDILSK